MQLAVVGSGAEHQELVALLEASTIDNAWIGGTDSHTEGLWHWVDGSPIGETHWATGQPHPSGAEDCLLLCARDGYSIRRTSRR